MAWVGLRHEFDCLASELLPQCDCDTEQHVQHHRFCGVDRKCRSLNDVSHDFSESRHCLFCSYRDGYTEAQIMAVSARYDVDVDHGVSRAELRKMQADLGRQKVSLQWIVLLVPFFQLP